MHTWSVDGNPWHPRHPSKEGRHQIWQAGYQDNHQRWLLWEKETIITVQLANPVTEKHWLDWAYLIFPATMVSQRFSHCNQRSTKGDIITFPTCLHSSDRGTPRCRFCLRLSVKSRSPSGWCHHPEMLHSSISQINQASSSHNYQVKNIKRDIWKTRKASRVSK